MAGTREWCVPEGSGATTYAHWGRWLGHWLVVTIVGTWMFTSLYFIGTEPLAVGALLAPIRAAMLLWLPVLIWVLPMTIAATVLRWLWLHLALWRWRGVTLPAVLGGLISGPLGELLARTGLAMLRGDPVASLPVLSEMVAWWHLSFAPPLLLGVLSQATSLTTSSPSPADSGGS